MPKRKKRLLKGARSLDLRAWEHKQKAKHLSGHRKLFALKEVDIYAKQARKKRKKAGRR